MGTRHLTIVKLGEKLFGQYGQWDGYPDGAGVEVFDFVRTKLDLQLFKERFEAARFVDTAEANSKFTRDSQFSRDMGAGILDYIQQTWKPELFNSIDFAADSLFCEWAWMLDLDKKELVVFRGFNKEPLKDGEPFKFLDDKRENSYYPIKHWVTMPFSQVKEFADSKAFLEAIPNPYPDDE